MHRCPQLASVTVIDREDVPSAATLGVQLLLLKLLKTYKHFNKITLTGAVDERGKNRVYCKIAINPRINPSGRPRIIWSSSEIPLHLYYVLTDVPLGTPSIFFVRFLPKNFLFCSDFKFFQFPFFSNFPRSSSILNPQGSIQKSLSNHQAKRGNLPFFRWLLSYVSIFFFSLLFIIC